MKACRWGKAGRDDELELAVTHGVRVVHAHGGLQRDKVLTLDAVRLLEHLPPALLDGRLRTEHRKARGGEPLIPVALD